MRAGRLFGVILAIFLLAVLYLVAVGGVSAQGICWPQRSFSQHRCVPAGGGGCLNYRSSYVGTTCYRDDSAVYDTDDPPNVTDWPTAIAAWERCVAECPAEYGGGLYCSTGFCTEYEPNYSVCEVQASMVGDCFPEPKCTLDATVYRCVPVPVGGEDCTREEAQPPLGCWGPGPTNTPPPPPPTCPNGICGGGETCLNCPADCGACPTPTTPPGLCPNGDCGPGEDCVNCPADCGLCPPTPTPTLTITPTPTLSPTPTPTPSGSLRARAKQVLASDTTCTAVAASTTYVTPTDFDLSPPVPPGVQTQSGSGFVTWNNALLGSYTLLPSAPATYGLQRACWTRTTTVPTSGEGLAASLGAGGETLTWELGYTLGSAWAQTGGADVYASGSLTSFIPAAITPREFNLDGTGNYPGVVTYGATYDFDSNTGAQGETLVSSSDWLANETYPTVDFYDIFYRKFGAATATDNGLFPNLNAVAKPASRLTPYYIVGDMTTSGNWSVADGEMIVFLVNGNLTLGGNVNITGANGTGFISFIVNGDITVASSVGGAFNSITPVIEGVYITNPAGTFRTGAGAPGTERLVGRGIFVSGSFALQRDLDSLGQNPNYAAELFTYNPQLLITMPDEMKDALATWQEVAP